jgi:polar amino acid transport system substrate-binding protein
VACSTFSSKKRTEPYIIAYPSTWKNIQLYGTEQNVVGFSSDLIYEIVKKMGVQARLVMADQDLFPTLLEDGKIDAILTSLSSNPATDKFYEFSNPYFASGIVVVVASNSVCAKMGDLKNVEIAYDRSEGLDLGLGVKTSWIFKPYDSTSKAIEDVIAGKVDGMVLRFINASRLCKSLYRTSIRILLPPLVTENVRIAVRRGKNKELIELFNKGVDSYIKSGAYKELLEYWGIDGQLPIDKPS